MTVPGMDHLERRRRVLVITRRLILLATVSLFLVMGSFSVAFSWYDRLMLSWVAFECGILGGFVSIQQRLKDIDDDELFLISESWFSILLIPIYGGIFALVLYVVFLSGMVTGELFPRFYVPPFGDPPTSDDVAGLILGTVPLGPADLPKLMFWSFAAGFSERLVPQIIQRLSDDPPQDDDPDADPAPPEDGGASEGDEGRPTQG
ncbi:MAG: hypothetical protein H6732_18915 [Alphaproteobacteria bacterium]|nr:hypothetical protein [Alphaproteobacteria bacterium]